LYHHEILRNRELPDKKEEEGLAGSIFAYHAAECRAARGDMIEVAQHSLDLAFPANLDVLQSEPGHHAGPERADDDVAILGFN
jgi:hypothetical protein